MSQRQSTGSTKSNTSEDDFNNRDVAVPVNDWLLETLLEHLCSLYVRDSQSHLHERVYHLLKDQLKKIKIDYPVTSPEDVRSIRRQCSTDFNELVKDALKMFEQQEMSITVSADIQQRLDTLLQPRNSPTRLMIPSRSDSIALYTSRYSDEFAEKRSLGKGGYGVVFNAKHKLDNCHYAVKKIYVCGTNPLEWIQILQEVCMLAQLSHKHVVRYYGVWLEHNNPFTAPTEPSSEMTKATIGSDSSDGGVVFADGSDGDRVDRNIFVGLQVAEVSSKGIGSGSSDGGVVFADGSDGDWVDRNIFVGLQVAEVSSKGPSCSDSGDSSVGFCDGSWCLSERTIMKNANVVLHIQMELCTKTLADWLDERNRQTVPSGKNVYTLVKENYSKLIMREILEGIKYIHDKSIIHRDLKPENIFLVAGNGDEFHVKIGDFGLSRMDTQNMPNDSHQGVVSGARKYTSDIGTKSYAAPEQLETSSYSTKADMFSLGLIMFELYQPFSSGMEKSKNFNNIRNDRQLPKEFAEKWPDQAACIKRLVGDADKRPSAEDIIPELFVRTHEELVQFRDAEKIDFLKRKNENLKEENLRQEETIMQQQEQITQQQQEILQLKEHISKQQQQREISQQEEQVSQQPQEISQQEEQVSQQQQEISQQEEQISQQQQI